MAYQDFADYQDSIERGQQMDDCPWMTTCPDCGTYHSKQDPCPYCYETTTVYRITFRGKLLDKFHGEEPEVMTEAWARYDELAVTRKGLRFETTTAVVSRCEKHPYED